MNQDRGAVLDLMGANRGELTPESRTASDDILQNPNNRCASLIRASAGNAGVKPNTLVQLGRQLGFRGYDELRKPFRDDMEQGSDFQDRAQWLQALAQGDRQSELSSNTVSGPLRNNERTFAENADSKLNGADNAILSAQKVFVLGVGHMLARNFAYLAGMISVDIRTTQSERHHPLGNIGRVRLYGAWLNALDHG